MHPSSLAPISPKRKLESMAYAQDEEMAPEYYHQRFSQEHNYEQHPSWHHRYTARQRQESGSSVSSTSSWGSAASFSSSYSNSSTSECPPLMAYSPKSMSSSPSTRSTSPQPSKRIRERHSPYARESTPAPKAHTSSLSDLVFAIALDASLTCALKGAKSSSPSEVSSSPSEDPQLRIVFSAPDWLNQHMKLAKRVALQRSTLTPVSF
ncbi:hypothetical protein CPC16_008454 [Podila verticillata]|nr:hypothetical protein BGZ52_001658 [Haplosporangium bisporale]KAF9384373.1 hypothetical protein CPC16_008454 [Podila verticillata]KFH65495.1 hypothetical protein MVEG_08973 [Podila verticillata NRRL 6337]